MMWTMIMTVAACVVALMLWGTGGVLTQKVWFTRLGNVAWLGLVASFGLLSMEVMHGGASLLASASFAASCMVTTVARDRWGGVRMGGAVASILGVCAVILAANSYYEPVVADRNLVLFAGQWAALAAAVVAALMAVSYDEDGEAWSSGVVVAMLALGALWMGSMRADLPGFGYMVELTSEGNPVRWTLPSVTPGASLFGFKVTQHVARVEWALVPGAALGLGAALATWMGKRKVASSCYLIAAILGAVALGMVLRSGFQATLPDVAAYAAFAYEVGVEKGVPEQVLVLGGFDYGETIYVLWLDVLGDVGLMLGVIWFALAAAWRQRKGRARDETSSAHVTTSDARLAQLFCARAAGLLWMTWILGLFVNWRLHAVYGVGSATEWALLGAALLSSGAALMALDASRRVRRLAYLLVMLAVVLVVVLSLVFEVPPGVVMS